jgi:hypothetical protein
MYGPSVLKALSFPSCDSACDRRGPGVFQGLDLQHYLFCSLAKLVPLGELTLDSLALSIQLLVA